MVSFDKSKEPKIKNEVGSHECNSFYSVCKYCIDLFFLILLNKVKISSKSELFASCQVFFSFSLDGWLVVFNVPSTARSFRDGFP